MTLLPLLAVNVTVLPGVAVPLTTFTPAGCVVLLAGELMATVGGATTVKVLTAGVEVPPKSLVIAVTLFVPAVKAVGMVAV